ncbi:MAG: tRNA uridine-5-carboxymethylaminomethyl(34) synthesis GTPase MnmE [Verrucomicrobiota bacterium]
MPASDTIVALSTPVGESAIALIRLSGPDCAAIGQAVLGRDKALKPRHASFGNYLDVNGKQLDDCIVTYFSEGKSYSGEPMLEIAPHGNPLIVQKIIEDLLTRGCRAAEPGEFTRTAFLNGKMDLSQAEAVVDLIRTRSDRGIEIARRQLHGSVGRKMGELTNRLINVMAHLEAYIDFPEEDLPTEDQDGPAKELKSLIVEIKDLISTQHYAALLHEGIKTMIIGSPNVGKSSLINALTGMNRAIVSDVPGTTRDFIASFIMLDQWRIEILDTAGLHESDDAIEQIGISHTVEQAETADFFLLVLDSTAPSPLLPDILLERMNPQNTLILENKTDLVGSKEHADFLPEISHCRLSLKENQGLDLFKQDWLDKISCGLENPVTTDGVVVNARHAHALKEALDALVLALDKIKSKELSELIAADLRDAIDSIGKVVGKVDNERMLDSLFKQFCIGK